ncbi:MvaI/BcnI restriction endonuclease family protein [Spirosoma sp. BT702]|uniref:MvaI/BcnI restriction endonuclease family protein n=1 Tax=Spirosoma profusum TaxID=2771354 RepID=A0A926XTA1_9BACT|nr:MvaI/BcnI family restriction endonuclease [Spirosoma profusum]MBD2699833.1 MvaI/BcnI restriction endonuclease family protein [Spirosoma profusum]
MNLERLKKVLVDSGCQKVYVKKLSANDNSKNQVYLGGSFDVLNIFPVSEIRAESPGDWERERFKAACNFSWISDEGVLYDAPNAQFILYPKYPEVRFSGFLANCEKAPSDLMTVRETGRLLFLSVTDGGCILGFVTSPNSSLATEFSNVETAQLGVFQVFSLLATDSKYQLLQELKRIHLLNWINSKRLDRSGNPIPCDAPNCGGYTLEAELGITPNGYSEPDFLGWEIKQFSVSSFQKISSKTITLMTPEPTGGIYVSQGFDYFMRHYGYADKRGRADRINFGGIHIVGARHPTTKLYMDLIGFDNSSGKIRNADGRIALIDPNGNEAATWSFASMLRHWNKKHNQACYVPSQVAKGLIRQYRYGSSIILGVDTSFDLFLQQMALGNIYYDPGIKLVDASSNKPSSKRRSQFRTKSLYLNNLYRNNEIVDLTKI